MSKATNANDSSTDDDSDDAPLIDVSGQIDGDTIRVTSDSGSTFTIEAGPLSLGFSARESRYSNGSLTLKNYNGERLTIIEVADLPNDVAAVLVALVN